MIDIKISNENLDIYIEKIDVDNLSDLEVQKLRKLYKVTLPKVYNSVSNAIALAHHGAITNTTLSQFLDKIQQNNNVSDELFYSILTVVKRHIKGN